MAFLYFWIYTTPKVHTGEDIIAMTLLGVSVLSKFNPHQKGKTTCLGWTNSYILIVEIGITSVSKEVNRKLTGQA